MKRTIFIAVLTLMTVSMASSCESFLDQQLKGDYTSDNYYTSSSQAEMAVNAVYNSLYGNTLWIFGDVASDDAVKGGNAGDEADINDIDDFSALADNGCISTFWQSTYETIARANNVIANVSGMDIDEKTRDRYIGEAKFLRAYSYFNLVNIFGEVPLKLLPQTSSATINVGLSSVDSIYGQIDEDLSYAASVLPVSYSTETGRATKGAAFALLAKSKLFQKDYADCLEDIDSIENLHVYGLLSNYGDLFKAGAEDSIESIFAIRYVNNTEVSLGDNLDVWFSPSWEGGYYFDAPTQAYVDCFTEKTVSGETDPRLDASIGRDGHPWFNDTTFSSSWSEATGYLVKKYDEDLSTTYAKSQSTIPQHIIRYADVILMKAEALNELGSSNVAFAAAEVDRIRERAGLAPTTATTQSGLRDVIRNERRKELGFEFHRFFDVMRYGNDYAQSVLGSDLTWSGDRFYFPIPQAETETNKALQND
ncbi:MAG: RagB/SusD family nutrient uptake outer membrane protein [Bacteroidales bacterium]|jgi:hypothetical protein|nr:RagB/SusD family nutrient uptake outer membrane protein [Bacteroidales bacterium]MCI2121901.1 RagB/SusD family nutrient uptake outer membrane protein [Bacteroidales bacterium]MCI2145521.1 RagB/SusD family nutrient uptake outer membrane protein [Bacteroidales bacterium]